MMAKQNTARVRTPKASGNDVPGRVERKRLETRARILVAAEDLMRNNPVDSVTIQDITDAADVGHGSFYLHFKSKNEVLVPIIQAHAKQLDDRLQQTFGHLEDPAELMTVSCRYMARMVFSDELWKWFMRHSGIPVEDMRQAVGRFSERDFYKGYQSGRFDVPDKKVTSTYAFGGFVNSLMASFECKSEADAGRLIDQGAELMLRVFGLTPGEAKEIAHRPLPKLKEL